MRETTVAALSVLLAATPLWPVVAVAQPAQPSFATARLTPDQMLALSDEALAKGRADTAKVILEALLDDPQSAVRNEARFRLAQIAEAQGDLRQAAQYLRAILDAEPGAQRVRLELARLLAALGDAESARREVRQVQAGHLPPEVARLVDRFSAALRQSKRWGGDLELALAPDSNINRATRSDTLGTVLGEFDLSDDAKSRSGLGLALRISGYARVPMSKNVRLVTQGAVDASLYGKSDFNDVTAHAAAGAELERSGSRLALRLRGQRRWHGQARFSDTVGIEASAELALSRTAQLRLSGDISRTWVGPNPLQDADTASTTVSLDKALSPRAGVSLSLSGGRQAARDPGYSAWFGQAQAFGWREVGRTTLLAGFGYGGLQADERLALFPAARRDRSVRATLGATLRQFTVSGFAPQLRVTWERTESTIAIYSYSRLRSEVGVVRAF